MDSVLECLFDFFEKKFFEKDWKDKSITKEIKFRQIKEKLSEWLAESSKKISGSKASFASSHPCKFVNPDSGKNKIAGKNGEIKTTAIVAYSKYELDGYVRTGNVRNIKLDLFGDAAMASYYKFLTIRVGDKTIFEHIVADDEISKYLLSFTGDSSDKIRKDFLSLLRKEGCCCTSSKLKQIFFPTNEGYHQLSVLMPSGIMSKVNQNIRRFKFGISEDEKKQIENLRDCKKNNLYCDGEIKDFQGLTKIGFGGSKPVNISILNSEENGLFYFLPSFPPAVDKNRIKLPHFDFFKDNLWSGKYRTEYKHFHKLLLAEPNNINIREGRNKIILNIFDDIVENIFTIRSVGAGWSDRQQCSNLPEYQKIMLDDLYSDRRDEDEYFNSFLMGTARFIQKSYKNNMKDAAIPMADNELVYYYKLIEKQAEILR